MQAPGVIYHFLKKKMTPIPNNTRALLGMVPVLP